MTINERSSLWRSLRDALRKAKSADTSHLRDACLLEAEEHADRLAYGAIGNLNEPSNPSYYLDCALTDIGEESDWRIPLSL